ncbi:MAG: RnfABCDGE type electron transport complex subunit G [Bacteroidales bacterium]|nr:RnfABCDGE type electron transport complex subunit G [Bacteroidales bacterium]
MAKTESSFINMVVTLFAVTAIAALALGGIYTVTKAPIELAKRAKLENALGEVLPSFDSLSEYKVLPEAGKDSLVFFKAMKGSEWVGTAVKTYTDIAFSGRFSIMVGFLPDRSIFSTSVLEHKETPGLGDKIDKRKSDWSRQFEGENPGSFILRVKKDGGNVDAITAATISSRAFCDAVSRAYNEFEKQKSE